jgi:hypothetical protein
VNPEDLWKNLRVVPDSVEISQTLPVVLGGPIRKAWGPPPYHTQQEPHRPPLH